MLCVIKGFKTTCLSLKGLYAKGKSVLIAVKLARGNLASQYRV